jgi:uncharacterized protein (TIGR02147 family)
MKIDLSIFNYINYRDFLRDAFAALKAKDPSFTYRKIASELELGSIGHITWIIQGKRNLTLKMSDKFISLLQLNQKEATYLKLLISFTNSKKHIEKKFYFEKIASVQSSTNKIVSKDKFQFWDKWYYSVMREMVGIHKISDNYKETAKLFIPRISPSDAEEALNLLENLDLIKKDENGCYLKMDNVVTTGEDWESLAIKQFQMEMLDLAKTALEKTPKSERDISTVTLSISESGFEELRKMFKEFRQKIIALARTDSNAERIYQVGLQIFPMSKARGDKEDV